MIPSNYAFLAVSSLDLCLLSPSLCSVWTEESQCTLLNVSITETFNCSFSCGPDCWKLSQYPCLQVYVNLTSSGEKLLLYHTEETMKINQKVGHPRRAPTPSSSLPEVPLCQHFKGKRHQGADPASSINRAHYLTLAWETFIFCASCGQIPHPLCGWADLPFTSIEKSKPMSLFIHKWTESFKVKYSLVRVVPTKRTDIAYT